MGPKIFKFIIKKFISIILKPSVIFSLLIYLIGLIGLGISSDPVFFDWSDDDTETKNDDTETKNDDTETKNNDSECETIKGAEQQNSEPKNKDISSSHTSDYSNSSKWYVERMKFAYEQMMEHEFKWLEEEKQEYERTKVLPENSLHSTIAESREQDAKEMMAINEALNKFNLNENPNDIGSSDNKRSIVEEDSSSTTSEESKKYKIVAENETNVDNVTNKNVNSNNK